MEKENSNQTIVLKDTTANPAPLGLMGFGMTTILLNLHNAGLFKLGTMILAMGICYGGLAQILAGIYFVRLVLAFVSVSADYAQDGAG